MKRKSHTLVHPILSHTLNHTVFTLGLISISAALLITTTRGYASKINYLPAITLTNQNARSVSLSS